MTTVTTVLSHISNVTPEQVGRCFKVYDEQTKENFYQVENESGNVNDDGEIIVYDVRYSKERGFTCTCAAGSEGFIHCKYGFCKHILWSVAASQEERAALAEIATEQAREHTLYIDGRVATDEEYDRIINAPASAKKGGRPIKGSLNGNQGFNLMR